MKKLVSFLLLLLVLPISALADVNLSGMSFDDLVALRDQLNLAIWNSQEWQEVTVPQGVWKVGEDIPAGHWTIKAANGAYCRITYGDVLDNSNDISYRSNNRQSDYIYSKSSFLYDEGSSRIQMDIDMQENYYVQIEQGNCVFSPYIGKPSLGFADVNGFKMIDSTPPPTPVPVDPDGYAVFDFQKASRYPDEYIGTKVRIEGQAIQIIGSREDGYDIRLSTSGSYGDIIYIVAPADSLPSAKILEDDLLRIKATMYGEYTYESRGGDDITLPIAYANSVEILNLQ